MHEIALYAEEGFPPRFRYRICTVEMTGEGVLLREAGLLLPGKTAELMLREAPKAALVLCTLGLGFDTALRSAQARDMARAVMLDACGSALVEAGCDQAEEALRSLFPGAYLTDRFSPGYGDLPLNVQPGLLSALDAQRRLGVYVTDGCLMNPSKSVTAVIGLCEKPQRARIRGCAFCALRGDCVYRKRGTECEKI
ncbi:MAG: methionine synthase [Clostridia bacterium]|nr:methionine synthase [Clostridia bacterium]